MTFQQACSNIVESEEQLMEDLRTLIQVWISLLTWLAAGTLWYGGTYMYENRGGTYKNRGDGGVWLLIVTWLRGTKTKVILRGPFPTPLEKPLRGTRFTYDAFMLLLDV